MSLFQVLTHNIGNELGMENVEKYLVDFRHSEFVSFLDYLYFLKVALFDQIAHPKTLVPQTPPPSSKNIKAFNTACKKPDLNKVDRVCWYVCFRKYLEQRTLVCDNDVYKLWQMFNSLAEVDGEVGSDIIYPVVVAREEILLILQRIIAVLGCSINQEDLAAKKQDIPYFSFPEFLELLEKMCAECVQSKPDSQMLSLAIGEIHEDYIVEVLKKVNVNHWS